MRSSSTSEKTRSPLQRGPQFMDMLARKSDLCWLAISSSLVWSATPRTSAVDDGQRRLPAEGLEGARSVRRESAPCSCAGSPATPTILSPRSMGTARTERQPSLNRSPDEGRALPGPGREPPAAVGERCPDHQRRIPADGDRPATVPPGRGCCRRRHGPGTSRPTPSYSMNRSAVGSGEPHGVADDPVQDLVGVEARADASPTSRRASSCAQPCCPARPLLTRVATRSHPGRRTPREARVHGRRTA